MQAITILTTAFALVLLTLLGGQRRHVGAQEASPVGATAVECPRTTEEENVALVDRFFVEVENEGNLDLIDELFAADYVHHSAVGDDLISPDERKARIERGRAAFPDFVIAQDLVMSDGDLVTVRWTLRGTHEGAFRGIAATGRSVTYTGISIFRIVCGRIAESWDEADLFGLLEQIGPNPPTATPTA